MKRDEVIEHVCQTVALVYHSIGDYSEPSDGFCTRCPNHANAHFQHGGKTLRYVRDAVVAKLKADGIAIHNGFDPVTGDEIIEPNTAATLSGPSAGRNTVGGLVGGNIQEEQR